MAIKTDLRKSLGKAEFKRQLSQRSEIAELDEQESELKAQKSAKFDLNKSDKLVQVEKPPTGRVGFD